MRRLIRTTVYEKSAAKFLSAAAQAAMEAALVDRPEGYPVVPGTGGFRKARWARQGKGKSGGLRVIYFFAPLPDVLYLFDVYPKNQKENLTDAEKNNLKKLAASIQESLRAE